jgi:phosphonate transport system substrate-binding protein
MAERETELTAQTRVVARSAWHGFPPICCLMEQRDAPLSQSLARALEGMKATPSGARILATLQLEGFIPADLALYEGIARMSDAVRRAG